MTNDLIETSDEIMPHMHVFDAFMLRRNLDPGRAGRMAITNAIVAPQTQDTLPWTGHLLFNSMASPLDEMMLVRDITCR